MIDFKPSAKYAQSSNWIISLTLKIQNIHIYIYIHIFKTSWWFHPIRKICSSNFIISPRDRGENQKNFELPRPSTGANYTGSKLSIYYDPPSPIKVLATQKTLLFTFKTVGFGVAHGWNNNQDTEFVQLNRSLPQLMVWGKNVRKMGGKMDLGPKTHKTKHCFFFLAAT